VPGPVAADTALFQIDEEPGALVPSLVATVTGTTPVLLVEAARVFAPLDVFAG